MDATHALRWQTLKQILETPGAKPIKTKALAYEIASLTADDVDGEEFDSQIQAVQRWLSRVSKSRDSKAWRVFSEADNVHVWQTSRVGS